MAKSTNDEPLPEKLISFSVAAESCLYLLAGLAFGAIVSENILPTGSTSLAVVAIFAIIAIGYDAVATFDFRYPSLSVHQIPTPVTLHSPPYWRGAGAG